MRAASCTTPNAKYVGQLQPTPRALPYTQARSPNSVRSLVFSILRKVLLTDPLRARARTSPLLPARSRSLPLVTGRVRGSKSATLIPKIVLGPCSGVIFSPLSISHSLHLPRVCPAAHRSVLTLACGKQSSVTWDHVGRFCANCGRALDVTTTVTLAMVLQRFRLNWSQGLRGFEAMPSASRANKRPATVGLALPLLARMPSLPLPLPSFHHCHANMYAHGEACC